MKKQTVETIFDTIFLAFMLILVVGIPLAFTSYTRSVFEVNKLILLRYTLIFTYGVWLFKYVLFKDNNIDNEKDKSTSILFFRWKNTGLELPIAIWLVVNIISTVFSQNIKVSIIGAYDRWEGIITIVNYIMLLLMYIKLMRKRFQVFWIMGGIIAAACFSAMYGIYQSLGTDFMQWSVDPTSRVFACINNPVHFCAYMAMVVPIGMGLLLFFSDRESRMKTVPLSHEIIKWVTFFATCIIYYAQYLSFSKATWLAFVGSMTLFYLIITDCMDKRSDKQFISDFFITALAIGITYVTVIFNVYKVSNSIAAILFSLMVLYCVYSRKLFPAKNNLFSILSLGLVFFVVSFPFANYSMLISIPLFCIVSVLLLVMVFNNGIDRFLARIFIIIIFFKLQFVAISMWAIIIYMLLMFCYYSLIFKGNQSILPEKKFWLYGFLFIFASILFIPSIPLHVSKIYDSNQGSLKALENVEVRLEHYKSNALEGTARTSMWRSSIPWIKDYVFFGSGLDTIKYMYPVYRESVYGILEGGHNFTPDRLHNEYLNTLATKGVLGFLSYYVGIILVWYVLVLKGYIRFKNNPYRYIAISFLTGASIYLGQVFFNFGVVATLFIFYVCMGCALAVILHRDFGNEVNEVPEKDELND